MLTTYNSYLPEDILMNFLTDNEKIEYRRRKRFYSDYDTAISIMERTNQENG